MFLRISEIADYSEPKHPSFRTKYVHLMPLAELISTVYDKGVTTKTVQGKWQNLIDNFRTEIDVLINVSVEDVEKNCPETLVSQIKEQMQKIMFIPKERFNQ